MKRMIAVAAVPLMLGGCLPLPVTIASGAISGISYLTTGKFSTDHVLSAAVDQDCSLTRTVLGEAVCKDIDPNSPAASERVIVAAYPGDRDDGSFHSIRDPDISHGAMKFDELPRGPAQVAVALPFLGVRHEPIETPGLIVDKQPLVPVPTPRPASISVPVVAEMAPVVRTVSAPIDPWTPPATLRRATPVTAQSAAAMPPAVTDDVVSGDGATGDARYVVIGSLRDAARAERLAARFADQEPDIRTVVVDGRTWNRVVVGPYSPEQARVVKADLGVVDGRDPWIVRMEPGIEQIALR